MADETENAIDALLQENRSFPPSDEFRSKANASNDAIYETALNDREGFWAEIGSDAEDRSEIDRVLQGLLREIGAGNVAEI